MADEARGVLERHVDLVARPQHRSDREYDEVARQAMVIADLRTRRKFSKVRKLHFGSCVFVKLPRTILH